MSKPTAKTGEWTAEYVVSLGRPDQVAGAHNVALAAATARELHNYDVAKLCREQLAGVHNAAQQNQQLNEQLGFTHPSAAVREELSYAAKRMRELVDELTEARAQLAAERESKMPIGAFMENQQLREQIAAERENLMRLECDWHKVINEVLKCNPIPAKDRADGQLEPPWEVIARLREQLAAEREDRISWQELYEKTNEQLAAEREKYERSQEKVREYFDLLAAEREKGSRDVFWHNECVMLRELLAAERRKGREMNETK